MSFFRRKGPAYGDGDFDLYRRLQSISTVQIDLKCSRENARGRQLPHEFAEFVREETSREHFPTTFLLAGTEATVEKAIKRT